MNAVFIFLKIANNKKHNIHKNSLFYKCIKYIHKMENSVNISILYQNGIFNIVFYV